MDDLNFEIYIYDIIDARHPNNYEELDKIVENLQAIIENVSYDYSCDHNFE